MKTQTYESIAARLGDAELADVVCCALAEMFDHEALCRGDIDGPHEFCVVYSVYMTTGLIGGDGLDSLEANDSTSFYLACLVALEHSILANRLKRFFDGSEVSDDERRKLERLMPTQADRLILAIGRFMRSRPDVFSSLLSRIQSTLVYLSIFDPESYQEKMNTPGPDTQGLREHFG
ncbi:hypothetical protein NHH03_01555 [Stieleria sp. TO1_6]|uniref:hypothetical protein n=1 Tax=Stieleria tagensis TaxID=2956795 RepID=UPI00209B7D21|nr:hypothetical protein [Stieleria tagensis]MCO8120405.1 hypothetical protein [Stieleria tagensis]